MALDARISSSWWHMRRSATCAAPKREGALRQLVQSSAVAFSRRAESSHEKDKMSKQKKQGANKQRNEQMSDGPCRAAHAPSAPRPSPPSR